MPGIRSSPGFSKRGFEIHYPCKQGLCSKALVRVYTSICALDQVIENWSHLCKLCNNQEECGSVTPGCRKETSLVIRHKAGLEAAAAAAASNWKMGSWGGIWGDRLPLQDQRVGGGGGGTYTQGQHLKTCVFISSINQGSSWSPKNILRQQLILYQLTGGKQMEGMVESAEWDEGFLS